jgi:tetratricopeptide (TPR) repeat protein
MARQMAVLAAKELKRVVELNERYADGHYLLAEAWCMKLSLGNPLDVVKLGHKVGEEYNKALALDPRHADAYVSWAAYGKLNAPLSYGGGPDAAMETLAKALEIDPDHRDGNIWMGLCHLRKGDQEKAREYWGKVLTAEPGHQRARSLLDSLEARQREESLTKEGHV